MLIKFYFTMKKKLIIINSLTNNIGYCYKAKELVVQ